MSSTLARLLSHVDVGLCWEWTAYVDKGGYGRTTHEGRKMPAHRALWLELVGVLDNGLELDHLCRNRKCVNPDHLEPVTHAENVRRAKNMGGYRPKRMDEKPRYWLPRSA